MQYSSLIAAIEAAIYTNNYELITGDGLQAILKSMVSALANAGATYKGVITPASALVSSEQACFFLATEAGTYTNYPDSNNDPVVVTEPSLVVYDGGASYVFSVVPLGAGGGGAGLQIVNSDISTTPYLDILLGGDDIALRIDIAAVYSGGATTQRCGSLIISFKLDGGSVTDYSAYYYGHELSDLVSSIKVYDDLGDVRLTFEANSQNDQIIYTLYSMDASTYTATLESATTGMEQTAITPHILQDKEQVDSAIGKRGVISQTQMWAADYGSYTISNKVYGIIPQAFIDKWKSLVYSWGTFNESSGYFELNGLTDISYNEAMDIVSRYNPAQSGTGEGWRPNANDSERQGYFSARTSIPCISTVGALPYLTWNNRIEVTHFAYKSSDKFTSITQYGCYRLKTMMDKMNLTADLTLSLCYALETCYIATSKNITASNSKYLSLASIVYMVDNATNTGAVTYTFHANAYARCQADTTEYTYGGNTYTGVIAYAAARNITIVSA